MPVFEASQTFARPVAEVFDFFCTPANLPKVSPPELHMAVAEGPERLALGERLTVKGRRWGIPHSVTSKVIEFEPNVRFVDEQVQGPFRRFVHTHLFESLPDGGTRITDRIEYEKPGGALGLIVTQAFIEKDLRWVFDYRRQKLAELFGGS
jgi:ligand-binding SRPBCC domain-containing protein